MLGINGRSLGPLSLKHSRNFNQAQDEQPNTPSKSKMLPRRPYALYASLLFAALIAGLLVFSRSEGPVRDDTYYRKALVSKMYSTPGSTVGAATNGFEERGNAHLPRGIQNSEARQREALEIADRIQHLHGDGSPADRQQGELSAGGGSVAASLVLPPVPVLDTPPPVDDAQPDAPAAPGEQGAVAEGPDAPDLSSVATSTESTAVVPQIFSNGEVRELVVDTARLAFLDVMSNGLESEDLEGGSVQHEAWWSNVVTPEGDTAPPLVRPNTGPTAALATSQSLSLDAEDPRAPTNSEDEQCKIAVIDVGKDLGPSLGARPCDLGTKRVWPFSRHKRGIDGVETLLPEHYQYAAEYWISEAIRNSSRYVTSVADADFVFVDMWCYHTAWLAYIHPLGNRNTTNPEPYMRRTLKAIVNMDKFKTSKGGAFAMAHPSPIMRGLFSEEAMCEDLASVLHLVPERSSLCVWTQDSFTMGKSVIVPYSATIDIDVDSDLAAAPRDVFLFFRGGCGHPDPSIRGLFASGKMMRYEMVAALNDLAEGDIHAECSCDICDNHMPHDAMQVAYRRSQFCPVVTSNVQSSRRLTEAVLAGCIPVFMGPPFHTLPLAPDLDYASMAIFLNISTATWINDSSANHLQNHMVQRVWRLDDPALEAEVVSVESVADAVKYLRSLPEEVVAAKRASLLAQRWKFYYGPVPESAGGDGKSSELGELLMRRMCRRAAAVKRRMKLAAAQGMDDTDSDVQIRHKSWGQEERTSSVWSFFKPRNT